MKVYSGANDIVWAVTRVGPESNQIAAYAGDAVVIWDQETAAPAQTLPAENPGREHCGLSVSPDGKWLIAYSEEWLRTWRFTSRWESVSELEFPTLCIARFTPGPNSVTAIDLANCQQAPIDFVISRWKLNPRNAHPKRSEIARLPAAPSQVTEAANWHNVFYAVDLSQNGDWILFSAREKSLHVWSIAREKSIGSVKLRGNPNEAAFSPDGSRFAVDGGTSVYIHDTQTLEPLATWKVKYSYIPELAWSPDGRWLARTDGSTTVRFFDARRGQEARAIGARGHRGSTVEFSPDGLTYLVGTFRGSVVVWDMDEG